MKIGRETKGITLIGLIITIIVLLILAGVSISMITGDNGILTQAQNAKGENRVGAVQEALKLWETEKIMDKKLGTSTAKTLQQVAEDLVKQNLLTDSEKEEIIETGKVDINGNTIVFETAPIYAKLYSYSDGSGSLLELSSTDEEYTEEEKTEIGLSTNVVDYGNVNENYHAIFNTETSRMDNSIMPPWLTYSADSGFYMDTNNIIEVNIKDKIQPISTSGLFCCCFNLTKIEGLTNLDTSKVTDMSWMFMLCIGLTKLDNIGSWDTSNVTDMEGLFFCTSLQQLDLNMWNTSKVNNMMGIFNECESLTSLDVSGWSTSNVTNMNTVFCECKSLSSLDVNDWDTSNVTDMGAMFLDCTGLEELDLSKWNTSKVTNMERMFAECTGLTNIYIGDGWNTDKVTNPSDKTLIFDNCNATVGAKS